MLYLSVKNRAGFRIYSISGWFRIAIGWLRKLPRMPSARSPVLWRRERDSNPRNSFPFAALARPCLQPLGHLSQG